MSKKIRYRGFVTKIAFDVSEELYVGKVDGVGEFHGETEKEAQINFTNLIDKHIVSEER